MADIRLFRVGRLRVFPGFHFPHFPFPRPPDDHVCVEAIFSSRVSREGDFVGFGSPAISRAKRAINSR